MAWLNSKKPGKPDTRRGLKLPGAEGLLMVSVSPKQPAIFGPSSGRASHDGQREQYRKIGTITIVENPAHVRQVKSYTRRLAQWRGSTQNGPSTGTASRLTLTQTRSRPPGFMVDFRRRFRKSEPLDGIDVSAVSEILDFWCAGTNRQGGGGASPLR